MAVKMNLRIITKNHVADPEIGFLAKSISKSNGCATAMPTAWGLNFISEKMKWEPKIDPNLPGMPLGAATKFPVSPGPGICPYHKRHENTRLLIFQLNFKISRIFSFL